MSVDPANCPHTNADQTGRVKIGGVWYIRYHCNSCGTSFKEAE